MYFGGHFYYQKYGSIQLFCFHAKDQKIFISGFWLIFGNNSALQKKSTIFYIDFWLARPIIWVFWPKNLDLRGWEIFFDYKTCLKNFFHLRICEKLRLFCYWQKYFLPTFQGAHLLTKSVFQPSWKKFIVIRALLCSCMNYIFGKKFLVFYEKVQFLRSRWVLKGKFEIY